MRSSLVETVWIIVASNCLEGISCVEVCRKAGFFMLQISKDQLCVQSTIAPVAELGENIHDYKS